MSVNRKAVTTVAEFKKALSDSRDSGVILFHIKNARGSRFVAISIEE